MGDFWAVSCYYNSEEDVCRVRNFKIFAERLKTQGVPLLTVELVTSDEDKGNPDVKRLSAQYHRVVHPDVLWSKEALVNIGVKLLPPECTKVCWVDADIIFLDDAWGAKCSAALDEHRVVQPFDKYFFLLQRFMAREELYAKQWYPEDYRFGFAGNHAAGRQTDNFPKAHPGYAWAARRSVLEEMGGLYDAGICMADVLMAYTFIAKSEDQIEDIWKLPMVNRIFGTWGPRLRGHVEEWMRRAIKAVEGDVGAVEGSWVHHMYHGSIANRKFQALHEAYAEYDPYKHTRLNDDGVLVWTDDAPPEFKSKVKGYFSMRKRAAAPPPAKTVLRRD